MNHEKIEQSVIGAILLDNDVLDDVKEILEPDDFCINYTTALYEAILEMKTGIDVITLDAKTDGRYTSKIMLCNEVPTSANVLYYADLIKKFSIENKISKKIDEMKANPDKIPQKIKELSNIYEEEGDDCIHVSSIMEPVVKDMFNPLLETRGVKTRINGLDRNMGCLRNGDLIIIGARPGMGKSAMILSLMLNMGLNNDPSILFSLEMAKESLIERLLCQISGVSMHETILKMNMKSNNERIEKAIPTLYRLPVYINDRASKYNKIEQTIRKSVNKKGIKIAFIDYLQLISVPKDMGENRNQQLGFITRNLKSLAKELNIPIVLLAQLNRGLEQRNNKRPMLSDLRDSGEIEQDADVVMFLYRDEIYNKNSDDKGVAEIDVAKARNLSTFFTKLAFISNCMKFADLYID